MLQIPSKLPGVKNSIFSVMSQMAQEHGAINLSQGFPDFNCDPALVALVNESFHKGLNQYAPMPGILALRELVAEKIERYHQAVYHPETEITITAGGTQAIFTALSACVQTNDEVIIFEPAYDCYAPTVKLLGGVVKYLALNPPDYTIDWEQVKKLVSAKTRMIIINSPQNPTGKMLTEEDMQQLIKITRNTNILLLSDEVYEHIAFDRKPHLSVARYPELKERSFIIASFGKLFHTTGWKMGYCAAPKELMKEFRKIHQFLVFSVNTPLQHAIANYIKQQPQFADIGALFQQKRNYFRELLAQSRFDLLPCEGSYFQSVQFSRITNEADVDFASRLIKEVGVASIPVSAFYSRNTDFGVLRFCFAKSEETLQKAAEALLTV
ncbi:MAG: methionine aminotransferase [Sphingobacteriaceae bacterium]